jgi:hypothetical protein
MMLTQRQQKFVDAVNRDGEGWYVPSQSKLVKYLAQLGYLTITDETRFNGPKGSRERKVVPLCR